jgi:hypothetical protein
MRKVASYYQGTCMSISCLIHELIKITEKSISEIHEKFLENEQISFAVSLMASSFAFFHSGHSSNWHNCCKEIETERMAKWSDP